MTILTINNISKTFATQRVLDSVHLRLEPGEVHGLIGQNGSGKSTLIKVLAGYHSPDPGGEISVEGTVLVESSPAASHAAGLRFVHQDLGLVENLSTIENLALGPGFDTGRTGLISWSRERKRADAALSGLGHDIDVTRPVAELPMASRTAVAVARAMSARTGAVKVLVLDEPTANLPSHETVRLFELVRRVSEAGVAVVFVSHRLDEVIAHCSRATVLRDGKLVETRAMAGLGEADLVELMIGQRLESYDRTAGVQHEVGRQVLSIEGLSTRTLERVSLTVSAGEVVGIAGITGSGREDFAPAVFGGIGRTGAVRVEEEEITACRPDVSIAAGVGLVPADRHANALFGNAVIRENVSIVNLPRLASRGLIRSKTELSEVNTWLKKLDVRPPEPNRMITTLSGGNQQKVIIARWLRQKPRVLMLDEPTQGVDVGAKADIHGLVDEAAADGAAVVVVSTESEELARLCHRVVVLRDGQITETLRGDQITADRITAATLVSSITEHSDPTESAPSPEPSSPQDLVLNERKPS